MRRAVATVLAATVGLGVWIAVGAIRAEPYRASAQAPQVEIHRAQEASYLPAATNKPLFILALGSDARPGERVERRLADSIHVIAINPKDGAGTVLGFPRDSLADIPGVGQRKINDALFYGGPDLVVESVQNLTGIRIDYYLLTSFKGLAAMVNGIGGVRVDIPYAMADEASGAFFDEGRRKLSGSQALAFARNRKDTPDGDFSRSLNQGTLLLSALEKLRSRYTDDPAAIFEWIAVGLRHVKTDLSFGEVFDLMLTAVQLDPDKVRNLVAPGGIGESGGASVVVLTDEAHAIFADVKDDAIVGG